MNDETDEVPCICLEETAKAFKLMEKENRQNAWFPKSQVSFTRRNIKTGECVAVIPLWLLNEKGWNQ